MELTSWHDCGPDLLEKFRLTEFGYYLSTVAAASSDPFVPFLVLRNDAVKDEEAFRQKLAELDRFCLRAELDRFRLLVDVAVRYERSLRRCPASVCVDDLTKGHKRVQHTGVRAARKTRGDSATAVGSLSFSVGARRDSRIVAKF
jgi:hypothetical protein